MSKMTRNKLLITLLAIVGICLLAAALYSLPPVHDRLAWRLETLRIRALRLWRPPEQQVFIPQGLSTAPAVRRETMTPSPAGSVTGTPLSPTSPVASITAALLSPSPPAPAFTGETPIAKAPLPLPAQVSLAGMVHEYQQFNNCGPATLAMALSFWGWQGDQAATRRVLRPGYASVDDKNVNPSEMAAYVKSQPGLAAYLRVGGDLETLKRLLAAGYPVVIEIGIQQHPKDWMGHYLLLTGYDDEKGRFITQDSLIGADLPRSYAEIESGWQAFNRVYLVVYHQEDEADVREILGEQADPQENLQSAVLKNQQEVQIFADPAAASALERYFAWYNLGSSLAAQGDFPGAATAYDQAFQVYAQIPEDDRPWRMLWYQAGPMEAYFHLGRFQDVITLGNQALDSAGGPVLEEAFYWLGRAREATGDMAKAVYDYQMALAINPFSTPAKQELERLGISD